MEYRLAGGKKLRQDRGSSWPSAVFLPSRTAACPAIVSRKGPSADWDGLPGDALADLLDRPPYLPSVLPYADRVRDGSTSLVRQRMKAVSSPSTSAPSWSARSSAVFDFPEPRSPAIRTPSPLAVRTAAACRATKRSLNGHEAGAGIGGRGDVQASLRDRSVCTQTPANGTPVRSSGRDRNRYRPGLGTSHHTMTSGLETGGR